MFCLQTFIDLGRGAMMWSWLRMMEAMSWWMACVILPVGLVRRWQLLESSMTLTIIAGWEQTLKFVSSSIFRFQTKMSWVLMNCKGHWTALGCAGIKHWERKGEILLLENLELKMLPQSRELFKPYGDNQELQFSIHSVVTKQITPKYSSLVLEGRKTLSTWVWSCKSE